MSKRDRSTAGAFDAFARAIVDLGTVASWTALPPATAPASLARALGQGVLHGRLPCGANGARGAGASPLPVEQMQHEGQRSVAELGAILWHALDGPRVAPELAPLLAPPHTDPIIALAITRRRLAEYAVPEGVDRSTAFPGPRVWLIEIERARGDTPAGVAVWRSRGTDGEWRTRCACLWTHGRIGSTTHPLVIGAQWEDDGSNALAGACVVGTAWEQATRGDDDAAKNGVIARRQNAIGKQMMARIAIPAALAWLVAIVPGVWAGSHLIGTLAPGEAERGLGLALMLYAGLAQLKRSGRYAPKGERTVTLLAGSANGLVTGATGVLVIPMVPYMEALKIERDALVQLMAMVFCTSALALALVLAESGRYDPSLRNLSLWAVGPALAGVLAGEWLRTRMTAEGFRKWLLAALAGVGAKLALFG